jgi:restriction endonuclease Mrr
MKQLPQKRELMDMILVVMKSSNGNMNTSTINDLVAKQLNIPEDLLKIEDANCTGTEYSYRMRWARTELKQKGYIRNVKRGEWEICSDQKS